jgi:hypothetical protein
VLKNGEKKSLKILEFDLLLSLKVPEFTADMREND